MSHLKSQSIAIAGRLEDKLITGLPFFYGWVILASGVKRVKDHGCNRYLAQVASVFWQKGLVMVDKRKQPPYRVGIIGAGGIARAHGRVCQELDCLDLVAICDVSQEALDRYGEAFGVSRRYLDLGGMLAAEELDIAIICNWGVDHAATGIQIAESHKVRAILCEKPFTMNAVEAERLVASAQEQGVFIAEAFKFRHHPMHLKAKELVESGAIGDVISIRSALIVTIAGGSGARTPESNWRYNKAKGGGSVNDLGCYPIHYARWILGAEPVRIYAHAQPGIEVDDGAYLLLVFPGDCVAQISVGFNAWPSEYVEITGSEGSLRIDKPWNNNDLPTTIEYQSPRGTEWIEFKATFQYTHQLRHLCHCLDTGQPHRISPEDSICQMRVLDAVQEAMAK